MSSTYKENAICLTKCKAIKSSSQVSYLSLLPLCITLSFKELWFNSCFRKPFLPIITINISNFKGYVIKPQRQQTVKVIVIQRKKFLETEGI